MSGCVCPLGLVSDGSGGCVAEEDCPCLHNEAVYKPGDTIRVDCNTWWVGAPLREGGGGGGAEAWRCPHPWESPGRSPLSLEGAPGARLFRAATRTPAPASPGAEGLEARERRAVGRCPHCPLCLALCGGWPAGAGPGLGVSSCLPSSAPAGTAGGSAATSPAWAPAWPMGTVTSSPSTESAMASKGPASTRWSRCVGAPRPPTRPTCSRSPSSP